MAVAKVIKYEGGPDVFAWKHPDPQLGTWSQLIVNDSQEAVLFKGGQALDVFGGGRHQLTTNNVPLLSKFVGMPFGGKSPYAAEVWFINKVHSLDIKWGTATPIQLQDPKYGIMAPVRAYGQFGIKIDDSRKFLAKLVGTLPLFDKGNLTSFFRGLYLTKAKDSLSAYLVNKKVSILEINAYIDELSQSIKERIAPVMDEYGITLINFYVNDVSVPEDDLAVKKLKEALAKRAEMDIIGYNYTQERSFNTLEGAAKNPGTSANIMGAGMGLGMGVGMGGGMGRQFSAMTSQIDTTGQTSVCPSCQNTVKGDVPFCPHCGKSLNQKTKERTVKCGKCGAAIKKDAKFCPECGDKYNPCPNCGADLDVGAAKCSECGHAMPAPCPSCGAAISGNPKFCPECGKTLAKTCPKCGVAINGSPKFCPDCGEKL